jgi:hypothetical protein
VEGTNSNGCKTGLEEVRVTINPLPAAPTVTSSTVCQAGSDAILTASTSEANTEFRWYDKDKALIPGVITNSVTATNVIEDKTFFASVVNLTTGCESQLADGLLTVFPEVTFGEDMFFCTTATGNINLALTASPAGGTFGGPGVTGSIFNGQTLNYNKTYPITYTVVKGGCSKTVTKNITLGLDLKVTVDDNEVNVGEMVKFTPSINGQFQWDFGDNWTSSELTPVHYYYKPGEKDVKVKVTSANCTGEFTFSSIVKVNGFDVVTGMEPIFNNGVGVVNPVVENLIVFTDNDVDTQIHLSDLSGRQVETKNVSLRRGRNEVPMNSLPEGIYFLQIGKPNGTARFRVLIR